MRNVVNILGKTKTFPFLVESKEYSDYMVQNAFHLMFDTDTSRLVGENQFIISDAPVEGTMCNILYRSTNNWQFGDFHVSGYSGIVDPDDPILDDPEIRVLLPGQSVIIDGVTYTNRDSVIYATYGHSPEFPYGMKKRIVRVIVPDYSPYVYDHLVRFSVDISTRIGIGKIMLVSKIFSPDELLTLEKPFQSGGYGYHQYIDIDILDPWDLMYADAYDTFRKEFCYESDYTNNCGALLDIEIGVVVNDADSEETYIPSTEYAPGRNLILLSDMDSDYMSLNLSETPEGRLEYVASLRFNSAYGTDNRSVRKYFAETYFIDVDYLIPEIVVMDDDHIYKMRDLERNYCRDTEFRFDTSGLRFYDWSEYIDGMYIVSSLRLFDRNGNELLDIKSNSIPMTKERFSLLVGEELNIDDMDININNLDIVNKIEKRVVSLSRPEEYKSNIIKPVFYRAYEVDKIELHKTVTFNIGVDLDKYKGKIDSFAIQIEGMSFPEVGRVPGYVIFKIAGEKLPKSYPNGTYYILDGEGTMVTSGKYEYTD